MVLWPVTVQKLKAIDVFNVYYFTPIGQMNKIYFAVYVQLPVAYIKQKLLWFFFVLLKDKEKILQHPQHHVRGMG